MQILCIQGRYKDCTNFVVKDLTDYPNEDPTTTRNAKARYLLVAKMDEQQKLTYLVVDNSDPRNTIEWTILSAGIGAYRLIYLNIPLYNSGTTYKKEISSGGVITQYANIIYHITSAKLYKAIGTSFSNIEPTVTSGWENSWEEYTGELKDLIPNTTIDTLIKDDIVTCEYEGCIRDEVIKQVNEELCGRYMTTEDIDRIFKMELMLDGAMANNWELNATRSETILKEASKRFCKC